MATTKRVNIRIQEQGAEKAARAVGKTDKAMMGLSKSIGVVTAVIAGSAGLIAGLNKVITLAGFQEQAEKRLEVALGGVNKALLAQASALQQVTTFGDEAIIGVQASIAAFTTSEEQIAAATEATLDMAVALGIDLKSAGDLVAKTLGSTTNALTRYGVTVTGAVGSTQRLNTLTEGIAKLWGGQAAAAAQTMTGQIEQMKNSLGDLGESIGTLIAPAVIFLAKDIKALSDALQGLKKTTDEIKEGEEEDLGDFLASVALNAEISGNEIRLLTRDLQSLGFALDDSVSGFLELTGPQVDLRTWIDDITPAMQQFTGSIAAAAIYGQSMGDAIVSSLRAIAAELLANAALFALLQFLPGGQSLSFLPFVFGNTFGANSIPNLGGGSGGSLQRPNVNVNVQGPVLGDPVELGAFLKKTITEAERYNRA